jgi:hypothetical protein
MSVEVYISNESHEKLLQMAEVTKCQCIGTLLDIIIDKEHKKHQNLLKKGDVIHTKDEARDADQPHSNQEITGAVKKDKL